MSITTNLYHSCNSLCDAELCGPLHGSVCRAGRCPCKCHLTDRQIQLFQVIASAVFEEGGDGDIVVFPTVNDHELIGSKFHSWLVSNYPEMHWSSTNEYSTKRYIIYNHQEFFVFADISTANKYFHWNDPELSANSYPYTQRMDLAI